MPTLNCKVCNKDYHVPKYREHKSKYCSRDCQNNGQYQSITKTCECCKKEFKVSNSRVHKRFCSGKCKDFTNTTVINRRRESRRLVSIKRGSAAGKTVRKYDFDNKEAKCEICGYNEYIFCLDVHHVDNNPVNNELSNLAVLCCMCHKKLHKKVITYHHKGNNHANGRKNEICLHRKR